MQKLTHNDNFEIPNDKKQIQIEEFNSVVGTIKIDKKPTKKEILKARTKKYVK